MEKSKSQMPIMSLVIAGMSMLAFIAVNATPDGAKRMMLFFVCVGGFVGFALGVAGLRASRGQAMDQLIWAWMGIMLGGIVFLWSGLIFWLSTPF